MKFSDFPINNENPFMNKAIEQINQNVIKKYRSSGRSTRLDVFRLQHDFTAHKKRQPQRKYVTA